MSSAVDTAFTDLFPSTFRLRSGAGDGTPQDGLCFMQVAAVIAGEPITDYPTCASPVLTRFGIRINDYAPQHIRDRLLPLAFAIAGTASPEHEAARLRILGIGACKAARTVAHHNTDPRVMAVIDAAEAYWAAPSDATRAAVRKAHSAAYYASAAASYASAALAAAAAAATAASYAAAAATATAAAYAATAAAYADAWNIAIDTLREAIHAGPHSAYAVDVLAPRIIAVRDHLPVSA
jgi:hypothetical protein